MNRAEKLATIEAVVVVWGKGDGKGDDANATALAKRILDALEPRTRKSVTVMDRALIEWRSDKECWEDKDSGGHFDTVRSILWSFAATDDVIADLTVKLLALRENDGYERELAAGPVVVGEWTVQYRDELYKAKRNANDLSAQFTTATQCAAYCGGDTRDAIVSRLLALKDGAT